MTYSVFISHSTKPPGPRAARPQSGRKTKKWAEADKIWLRQQVLFDVREEIVRSLEADTANYQPWVDARDLGAGGRWRNSIHEALLHADAAVILMSPEARDSPWVLKEATVLTVFESVGFPIVIIPVFLGIRSKEAEEGNWSPLKLRDLQAVRVDVDDLMGEHGTSGYKESVKTAAAKVTTALGTRLKVAAGMARPPDPLGLWVEVVRTHFSGIGFVLTQALMVDLGLPESELNQKKLLKSLRKVKWEQPDPAKVAQRLVARELLLANEPERVIKALTKLKGTNKSTGSIAGTLRPAWFPAAAAADVPITARLIPRERVLVVNAKNPRTGVEMVRRAYCNAIEDWRVIQMDEPKGAVDPVDIVKQYRTAVGAKVYKGIDALANVTKPDEPVYVVVGDQVACASEAVDALLEDTVLEPVTFILLAGDEAVSVARRTGARLIEPLLPADADGLLNWFDDQLQTI